MDNAAYPPATITGNVNCFNVTNIHNFNGIVNVNNVIADENPEVMRWLSPLDPGRRHHDVRTDRVDGVGNWLLETNEFREWRSGEGGADKGVLFCYGNPGVGKTYISSLVIDSLCDGPGGEDIAVAMFYCDFRDQKAQSTTNIIGAILRQLVERGKVLEHVKIGFQKAKREVGGRCLRLPDMVEMLKKAVATLPRVLICIDALDELPPGHLVELLGSLKDILQESPRTRIFVTGRPHVESSITRYFTTPVIVRISPKAQDIKRYLEKKLEMDTECDAMSPGLREDILRIIPERISEIFLLVSLIIDAILGEVTISERRQKLDEITKGNHLGDTYAATLSRVKAQKGSRPRLGMEALMWVLNSERPLHTSELCHALGVKIGSTDLDVENVPTIRTLLSCSLGLITVDASSDAVRLVHFTLQEFLSSNPSLFQSPHSMITEVCLTYLNFRCVRELSPALSSAPSTFPFVEYASCYWGKHIRKEKTEYVNSLALRLLIGFERHISSHLLLLCYYRDRWWDQSFNEGGGPKGFTGLHGAAFLGIADIVATLLALKEWDINSIDGVDRTALAWAVVGGHDDVVKLLLEREDIKPCASGTESDQTPLLWAAERGHEGVVKLLLERKDINPNTLDTKYGQTPLTWAAERGHEGIVKLLLEREDIDPNTADTKYGQTPLSWAAEHGHKRIAELLLARKDINPNTADAKYGRTPLSWAAQGGHEGVVKLLLEREDINPHTADTKYGRTLLSWAAEGGHEGVVKLLLEREDIDPNTADTRYGRTPLWLAARGGHEGVVKLLLGRKDINPNTGDTQYGLTPLSWAVARGYGGVVKLLLERGDIDFNPADTENGRTPLGWAAEHGHKEAVKMLLERHEINPDAPDLNGETDIESTTPRGHTRVMGSLSQPRPPLPSPAHTLEIPEHPSPKPSGSLQNPSQSTLLASLLPSPPFPSDVQPFLGMPFRSLLIISFFISLFYILAVLSPSLSTVLLFPFHR